MRTAVDTSSTAPHSTAPPRSRGILTLTTVLPTLVAAALAWALAVPVLGADLVVRTGPTARTVGLGSVLVASLAGALGALALRGLMRRWTGRPRRNLLVVGTVLTVVSLGSPLAAAQSAASATALCALHSVVAATALPLAARGPWFR